MKKHTHCMHCEGPLGDEHRPVKLWVCRQFRRGRCCKDCWNGRLLGSLLYSADVCHAVPCSCGWCAEWKQLQAERARQREAANA